MGPKIIRFDWKTRLYLLPYKKHATNLDLYGHFRKAFLGGGFDPVENK